MRVKITMACTECKQRNYPVGSSVIYGYGIPAY